MQVAIISTGFEKKGSIRKEKTTAKIATLKIIVFIVLSTLNE